MMMNDILDKLDIIVPNARCELNYTKDYELLIATVLSAQTTDKKVNDVTNILWNKYDIFSLSKANIKDIEDILKPLGTQRKKAIYIINIAKSLVNDYNGVVPNDRKYIESLNGVGHKTCNIVLSNIYDVPAIAVDTHVTRVSKRLGIANDGDDVKKIEEKLMKKVPKDRWGKTHHQLVLFGRYTCKSIKPLCDKCLLNDNCKYYKKNVL